VLLQGGGGVNYLQWQALGTTRLLSNKNPCLVCDCWRLMLEACTQHCVDCYYQLTAVMREAGVWILQTAYLGSCVEHVQVAGVGGSCQGTLNITCEEGEALRLHT
jgi:hypothetical protein